MTTLEEDNKMNTAAEHFSEPIRTTTENWERRAAARAELDRRWLLTKRIAAAPLALAGAILIVMQVTADQPTPLWLVVGLLLCVPLLATYRINL
jgi:hypothetical protein